MNLSGSVLIISIFGFNIGIEIMQLFVVAITVTWLILLSQTPLYKGFWITGAIAALVASVAWIMERSTGNSNVVTVFISSEYQKAIWLVAAIAVFSIVSYVYYSNVFPARRSQVNH